MNEQRPIQAAPSTGNYGHLPFRFIRLDTGQVLVTSEAGDFHVLDPSSFARFARREPLVDENTLRSLEAKHLLYKASPETAVRLLATKLRTRKSFLRGGPSLHIFVVTLGCDHGCHYCQVSRRLHTSGRYDMSLETATAAVDRLFDSPSQHLTVEFQGGEPLLAFPVIRHIVELIQARNIQERRRIVFSITSTLHHLTDEVLEFMRIHDFQVSTSLDGPADLHNANRPLPSGDAHALTVQGLQRARQALGDESISALTTLTRRSLERPREIVDEYVRLGFRSIFLRPLSPFGFAKKSERRLGYAVEDYLRFYRTALSHILEINRNGYLIEEAYAKILLSSIMTPFPTTYVDLRSPVGSGFGTLVYNYDGGVYASDEGRMLKEVGNDTLRLGSVTDSYQMLMRSPAMELLAASGLAETLPGCSDCAFVPYCGPDPAGSLSRHGDPVGHRAESEHCQRHMGLFGILFNHLAEGDPGKLGIFEDWVHGALSAAKAA
ncbi:His-Xaa-Ser system radical SAM maturase HxsB (plasmid) [Microvirga sp. RSM25]|uniref:His-Xaa-Ser system radical SAM maturase HxsB n=1 Tax=Microvirga sp. RSM25 TaxID=3273802 RepID=UPI00384BC3FA